MLHRALLIMLASSAVEGARFRGNGSAVQATHETFQNFYMNHATGRGIWKWSNALDAYQRHYGPRAGEPLSLSEVGVQSGGSILMWQACLGAQLKFFGLDINPGCKKFADATTSITIGDQGDPKMWQSFYTTVTKTLDVLVDDGGHTPEQMTITLQQTFPHLNPGGSIAIEDIHGRHYVQSFFHPAATSIAAWHVAGQVTSAHVYPYLLIVHKSGGTRPALDLAPASKTVDSFQAFYAVLDSVPGQNIAIENAAWGSFMTEANLKNIFTELAPLHDYAMWDNPKGCATTPSATCTNTITNSNFQAKVIGVHIFDTKMVLEVAAKPIVINAVRRGTEFLPYGF